MKNTILAAIGAVALFATPALSADLQMVTKAPVAPVYVSPWDIAFGASIASDYNFRGITQSNHGVSAAAYFEPRFNITPNFQLYAGIGGLSVDFPAPVLSSPAAEVDLYFGVRPTFGPLSLDFGYLYYYYPSEIGFQTDFWEIYGKASYAFNDVVSVGANIYYSPSWLNTGANGTYASGTFKLTAPGTFLPADIGMYLSGELGRYWLGTTRVALGAVALPDYTYWNLGIGFTYKVFTLDLRYHDTGASRAQCLTLTGFANSNAGFGSNWCDARFIAKLAFDMTLANLK